MIISRTPLRVSFVGGGTDLPNFCDKEKGAVISIAIKKYVYLIVHPSFFNKNIIVYKKREEIEDINKIDNQLIKEIMKFSNVFKNVEIHSLAEVPAGTGLGSSSSFTVGLLNALYAYQEKCLTKENLAKKACKIEIDILKEPIGRQDQYAATYGGLNKIEFEGENVIINPIICKNETKERLEKNLMLFYLGGARSSSRILSQQNHNINKKDIFEMNIKMRDLAYEMETALSENDLEKFGELLNKNWMLKKQLAKGISNLEIDKYYDLAIGAGAKGGKLLGAGGTGFLLFYVEPEKQQSVREVLSGLKEEKIEIDYEGSKIIYMGDK
jgi:D-glycero-alpha-D-manno-heptose-7-phosphate kinase